MSFIATLRKMRNESLLAVHAAAIQQLVAVLDHSNWDFIDQHFCELYTLKENIAELRKAILQLAIMGRLTPPNATDQPASELLKEIEAEKQRLVRMGLIKAPKPLSPIHPDEITHELPQGWEWVRLTAHDFLETLEFVMQVMDEKTMKLGLNFENSGRNMAYSAKIGITEQDQTEWRQCIGGLSQTLQAKTE